jgi:hypothetical protein
VAQRQQLRGLGGIASGEEREPAEHPNHDQVEQSNSHELDHAPARSNSSSQPVRRVLARYKAIDVLMSARRDADAARRFFRGALSRLKVTPREVVTDAAAVYPGVLDKSIPSAWHHVEQYTNNPIGADHGRLKQG